MLFKSRSKKIYFDSYHDFFSIFRMKDNNIRRASSLISFASLYGMSDYVAFALGNYKKIIKIFSLQKNMFFLFSYYF